MTYQQELNSWWSPKAVATSPVPTVGQKAPTTSKLQVPNTNAKPIIVTFLRHCGCPFAEKTFLELRKAAGKHPEINFVAVSHSNQESTDKWVISVGGSWDVDVIVDNEREIYAQWGLGVSSAWHVLNPRAFYSLYKLGKSEKIWNRPTESGTRWQTAGSFASDAAGVVRYVNVSKSADAIPDFKEALDSLGIQA